MNHCSNPTVKPIIRYEAVRNTIDSSSTICTNPFGISPIKKYIRIPTGTVRTHKIEVWEIRRSASHCARLMGKENIKPDTTPLRNVSNNDANNKGSAAVAQIPRILAKTQTKNDLLR
jgi:hypothetical protein